MSDITKTADGCVWGRCIPACAMRPLYSCCGACMADTTYRDLDGETFAECWARIVAKRPELAATS